MIRDRNEHIRVVDYEVDAEAIADIYRHYVTDTTISFEIEPIDVTAMRKRIHDIATHFPYYVWEEDGVLLGYCYAHAWKERPAYYLTLETTIYLTPEARGRCIGTLLMHRLIDECRRRGYVSLIACITAENIESCAFHEHLGFKKVSCFQKVGRKFGKFLDVVDYQLLLI